MIPVWMLYTYMYIAFRRHISPIWHAILGRVAAKVHNLNNMHNAACVDSAISEQAYVPLQVHTSNSMHPA